MSMTVESSPIYIFGVDSSCKPYPKLVLNNLGTIRRALESGDGKVLDIGAGRGRFIKLFAEHNLPVRRYVAVEPCKDFEVDLHLKLKVYVRDKFSVELIFRPWQEVRDQLLYQDWDVIVAWDVAMFLDMRHIWRTPSFKEAVIREIAEWVRNCKVLLLSFWTVKNGLPEISGYENGRKNFKVFKEIVDNVLKLVPESKLHARFHYQNFIIINKSKFNV